MSLPPGYLERMIEKLRGEARLSYERAIESLDSKHNEYVAKARSKYEALVEEFSSKVKS